ncbi:hypothetical protein [Salinicola sp. MIT1003]|uniref:hypothetical protein n=1 Tax=Salinicola sp. MIT1003 TaxID=1882734 RepID=UPI001114C7C1|nr:hypothetical protein [Salinicola sp. MIT1003]
MKRTIIAIALASISIPAFADFTLSAEENRNSPLSILLHGKAVAVSTDPGKTLVIEKRGLDDSGRQVIQETRYDKPLQKVLESNAVMYGISHNGQHWSIETRGHRERVNAYTNTAIDSVQEAWTRGQLSFSPVDSSVFGFPLIQSGFVFANQIVLGNADYKISPETEKLLQTLNRPKSKNKNNQDAWNNLQIGLHNNEAREAFFAH